MERAFVSLVGNLLIQGLDSQLDLMDLFSAAFNPINQGPSLLDGTWRTRSRECRRRCCETPVWKPVASLWRTERFCSVLHVFNIYMKPQGEVISSAGYPLKRPVDLGPGSQKDHISPYELSWPLGFSLNPKAIANTLDGDTEQGLLGCCLQLMECLPMGNCIGHLVFLQC